MTDKDAPLEDDATVGRRPIDQPDHPPGGSGRTHVAEVETIEGEGQLKVGHNRHFTVYCDEPPRIGGTDKHPQPLAYLCLGVGF